MYSIERLLRRCCSYQWNVQNIVHLFLQVNPPMCVCFPNSLYPSPFVCLTMILCWTEKSSKSSFFSNTRVTSDRIICIIRVRGIFWQTDPLQDRTALMHFCPVGRQGMSTGKKWPNQLMFTT
jgi:hypothetical protein